MRAVSGSAPSGSLFSDLTQRPVPFLLKRTFLVEQESSLFIEGGHMVLLLEGFESIFRVPQFAIRF